ncbi:MAG: VanW family protein [Christensenellales bacterium]
MSSRRDGGCGRWKPGWTNKLAAPSTWLDDGELRVSIEENDTLVGYGTTAIYGGSNKLHNIELAASAVDGTELTYNDVFSFNDIVGARTSAKGYKNAVNGRGVKVVGGGVAQVASAIWLAIKDMDDIKVIDKHTYGKRYTESYVDSADDAIVTDYSAGTDFSFRYKGDGTLTIKCYVQGDALVCEINCDEAVG